MAEKDVLAGRISHNGSQEVKAPYADPGKKVQPSVKTGKDLRQK